MVSRTNVIDPSHAGGKWWLVEPMAKAAIAAGADGLMVEVHNNPEKALCDGPQSLRPEKYENLFNPEKALCDGPQSLRPEKYENLLKQISQIATIVGKKI